MAVTFLLALGAPWAVALAGHIKLLPVIVAIYWLGRRDWRALGRFAAWLVGLTILTFILEPAGTLAFIQFSDLSQVGEVQNRSLYSVSPLLWGAFVVGLLALAWRYARTGAGWPLAVAASVLASPRLLMYQLSSLQAAVRSPDEHPGGANSSAAPVVSPSGLARKRASRRRRSPNSDDSGSRVRPR